MRGVSNLFLRWLLCCALASSFTGCGSSPTSTPPRQSASDASWMAREAASTQLLYLSDQGSNTVDVYSYPLGKLVGVLTSPLQPAGMCVDRDRNVWIVETNASTLVEFPHGGKKAIRRILVTNATHILSCSVDPTSGDLAVTDLGAGNIPGDVLVYDNAAGAPKLHSDPKLQAAYFCAYDDKGNLFVDGLDGKGAFQLAELPPHKRLTNIVVNQAITFPGGVQWDGKYVAIGDQEYQGAHNSAIYQVSVSGKAGTVVGVTPLGGSCDVLQFVIPKLGNGGHNAQGTRIVAPDLCRNDAAVYNYPTGGAARRTFGSFAYPVAAVVSK